MSPPGRGAPRSRAAAPDSRRQYAPSLMPTNRGPEVGAVVGVAASDNESPPLSGAFDGRSKSERQRSSRSERQKATQRGQVPERIGMFLRGHLQEVATHEPMGEVRC